MKNVQKLERNELTKEELLPEFSTDFPYISSCAELDKYIDPKKYIGCAPHQVEKYLAEVIRPILDENRELLGMTAEISC